MPNLFPTDELQPIIDKLMPEARKVGKGQTQETTFQYFVERCKENVHVVLCFSPVGDVFRNRVRMYPSLVNCTTIDWFHPWPTEALKSVATRFVKEIDLDDRVKAGVVDVCVDMQERVQQLSIQFYEAYRRQNYVTPTSYLNLIQIFRELFEKQRRSIASAQSRYETGLQKLNETSQEVVQFQVKLEKLQPELIQSSKETAELLQTIQVRSSQVAESRAIVESEEKECNAQAEEAAKIAAECKAALDEAEPTLKQAQEALKVLKKPALDELKSMKVPSDGVKLTLKALCIMMGVEPVKVGPVGKKEDDWVEPAKRKLLNDTKLLARLQNFDPENIAPSIIANIIPIVSDPKFAPGEISKSSRAAECFCRWVTALQKFDEVFKDVKPRREALEAAQGRLNAAYAALAQKKEELKKVQDLLDDLNNQFKVVNDRKEKLEFDVKQTTARLERAEKLTGGLRSEKERWLEKATQLAADYNNVVGNILVSAGVIAYLGVFTGAYRDNCISQWVKLLREKGIDCSERFSLHRVLGDPVVIRKWGLQQLPKDEFSIDNAIILTKSLRWGLMVDPQEQANRWIKKMAQDEKLELKVVKQTDDKFLQILTVAVENGFQVLIENVGEQLEPALEPILLKQVFTQGGRPMIRIGSEIKSYSPDFRLYITTKLQNPHYTPEISTKVTIINFMVTPEGLEDQMLSKVVSLEEPGKERERGELITQNAEYRRQLQLIEDKILEKLNEATGNILDNEELISTLHKSKQASTMIEKKVAAAAKTEEDIERTRGEYRPVARSVAGLYFCIQDLANVDPMYQYSLRWFMNLFQKAVKDADDSDDVHVRIHNIERTFLYSLYVNVCRSLFEKDKLLFSFTLCLKMLELRGELDAKELRFLLTGGPTDLASAASAADKPNPTEVEEETEEGIKMVKWLSDPYWTTVCYLDQLERFKGLATSVNEEGKVWREFTDSADPLSVSLPGKFDEMTEFLKLLLLRCFRPDKILPAVQAVVSRELGREFTSPPPFDLPAAFQDSDCTSPLIFVLSPGVDPSAEVYKLASSMNFNNPDKLVTISLGQGQGEIAAKAINEAIDKGTWVLLQNCHLAMSWLPTLERLVDEISPSTTNPDFRLWLTSMPSLSFPVAILQNGVKITNEPPKGLQANLAQSYRVVNEQFIDECKKAEPLKKLLFGLCFFHAIVLERRKFGPVGWNVPYEFNDGDLSISKRQLRMFLDLYDDIPFTALRYLIGQLNYGGRVTDEWDRRTLGHILDDFISINMLRDDYALDSKGLYQAPKLGSDLEDYRSYIKTLSKEDAPELFGMHENANITTAIKEANLLFGTLLSLQPRTSSASGMTREQFVDSLAADMLSNLPPNFDVEGARRAYPVRYEESMNTVLVQELGRFNRLLDRIRSSLSDIRKAVKGEVVMSLDLERLANSLYDGQVPELWASVSYPSLKPLGSWTNDLLRRLKMFADWLMNGPPGCYWFSGFFFTQSFLTGTLQNFARATRIPIDQLGWDFQVMPDVSADTKERPEYGCYIHGLFLEGARWDSKAGVLADPIKGRLYSDMPVIWLKPCKLGEAAPAPDGKQLYACPVYKTSRRAGTLSTTGHSTNFVLAIKLLSVYPERHWVKRGAAMLTQLDA